jgi:hypothetical protein
MAGSRYPSADLVRQLLDYDRETGLFFWRARTGPYSTRWNARFAGSQAGWVISAGYIGIKIHDRNFPAHRLAFVIVEGLWPDVVDHLNGDPGDNRWVNLRNTTSAGNSRNQRRHKSNSSGRTGVSWNKVRSRWTAQIKIKGRSINLGMFDDFDSAVEARVCAEKKYGFTGRQ